MMDNRVRLKMHMRFSIIWDKSRWAENFRQISSSSWLGWVCWDMLEYARDRERQQRQPAGESPTLNSHNLVTAPISCLFLSDPGQILLHPRCQWLTMLTNSSTLVVETWLMWLWLRRLITQMLVSGLKMAMSVSSKLLLYCSFKTTSIFSEAC